MSDPILELLAAPPNPSMSVDETAVYAGGRRRLRRRALRRTGIGVVGIVGAAAIAFGTLGSGVDDASLPAGPSPSAPEPGRVSAELLDGRYAVEVVPGAPAGQPNVLFHAVKNGERQQLAGSDASPDVVSMGTGSGAEGVMLGTAPADARGFLTVTRDGSGSGGVEGDQQPLPGTGFQAVALDFEDPTHTAGYLDTIWLDRDGVVHHATGEVVPSVPVPGTDERVFVARSDARVLGVIGKTGGTHTFVKPSGVTELSSGEQSENGSWNYRSITLLPGGARDVRVNWSFKDWIAPVTLHALPGGDGTLALSEVASSDRSGSSAPVVLSVTWTDESGERHTEDVA
ncbi:MULTISPECIES: hypothetical protein [unclassified Knoellia]|uniref:hypothetical protein n=1 Tax=Knoellia altitudinis TaxID=3404795 RepID=UPI003608D6D4